MGEIYSKVPHKRYKCLPTLESMQLTPEEKLENFLRYNFDNGFQHGMWDPCLGKKGGGGEGANKRL